MKPFRHPLAALLMSLLLLTSQQAAFAHLLSHASGKVETIRQYQSDHGSIDGAADTCTTCIAFAGVGGGAPPTSSYAALVDGAIGDIYLLPRATSVVARPAASNHARAPPVSL